MNLDHDLAMAKIASTRDIALARAPIRWCVASFLAGIVSGIGATVVGVLL